jgi:60 kDa SS-A/Ro ribonucleoprotein
MMASVNKKVSHECERTHEGAVASRVSNLEQLKRSTMACMLWENTFYENGVDIAERIKDLIYKVGEKDSGR